MSARLDSDGTTGGPTEQAQLQSLISKNLCRAIELCNEIIEMKGERVSVCTTLETATDILEETQLRVDEVFDKLAEEWQQVRSDWAAIGHSIDTGKRTPHAAWKLQTAGERGSVVLNADMAHDVRLALNLGLASFGSIEEARNAAELCRMSHTEFPNQLVPLCPSGDACSVSRFATAYTHLEPSRPE